MATDKSGAKSGLVKLPEAGGTVFQESGRFSVHANKGSGQYTLPFPSLPSRNQVSPSISIQYNQFNGDSGFGVGWALSIPSIEVSAELGVPLKGNLSNGAFRNYLTYAGEKLVFQSNQAGTLNYKLEKSEQYISVTYHHSIYAPAHARTVSGVKPHIQSGFAVQFSDGSTQLFSADLNIAEGQNQKLTRFPLAYQISPQGEAIAYQYQKNDGRSYLTDIYFSGGASHYEFTLLDRHHSSEQYQYGFQQRTSKVYGKVIARYNSAIHGQYCFAYITRQEANFSVLTDSACQSVAEADLQSHINGESLTVLNQLKSIYRFGNDAQLKSNTQQFPAIHFDYSAWSKDKLANRDLVYSLDALKDETHFSVENFELADLNHDGLVDVLRRNANNSSDVFFGRGDGNQLFESAQNWQLQRGSKFVSPNLKSDNFHFADMNGDSYVDIVEFSSGTESYIYLGNADGSFNWTGTPVFLTSNNSIAAASFRSGLSRFVDLNADGKSDILTTTSGAGGVAQFHVYLNLSKQNLSGQWQFRLAAKSFATPFSQPGFDLTDLNIKLTDVNGDKLADLVQLRPSSAPNQSGVCVYPNRGDLYELASHQPLFGNSEHQHARCGNGGHFIALTGLQGVNHLQGLWLADVNGDGVLDYVSQGTTKTQLLVWLGLGNLTALAEPIMLELNTPITVSQTQNRSRVADIDGDGQAEILIFDGSVLSDSPIVMLDFNREGDIQLIKSNLLTSVEFDSGLRHDILYATSTDERIRNIKQNKSESPLHFPVVVAKQLISSYGKTGNVRSNVQVSEYFYHQPFYNADTHKFEGFSQVEVLKYGDQYAEESSYSVEHYFTQGSTPAEDALAGRLKSKEIYTLQSDGYFDLAAVSNIQFDPSDPTVHSLSTSTRNQVLPTKNRLTQSEFYDWSAQDLGGYFNVRNTQQNHYQYGTEGTAVAHSKIEWFDFDGFNLPHRIVETHDGLTGPFGIQLPPSTTVTEVDFTTSRSVMGQRHIYTQPDYQYVTRNGQLLNFQYYTYLENGLLDTESHYRLSGISSVPNAIASEYTSEIESATRYQYDEFGNLTHVYDDIGLLESVEYDVNGILPVHYRMPKVTSQSEAQTWTFEYEAGRIKRYQSPLSLWTTLNYDALGRRIHAITSDGAEQTFAYKLGKDGYPTFIKASLRRYQSAGSTPEGEQTWIHQLAAINADGTTLAEVENAHSKNNAAADSIRIKEFAQYNRNQQKVFAWTPYQLDGHSVESVFAELTQLPQPIDQVGKAFTYNALGQVSSIQYPTGKTREFEYYAWGSKQRTRYQSNDSTILHDQYQVANALGVFAVIEADAQGSDVDITRFERDNLGHLSDILLPDETQPRKLTYDNLGRLEYQSIPGLGKRYYVYDTRSRLRAMARVSSDGHHTQYAQYEYDALDRLLNTRLDGALYAQYGYDQYSSSWKTTPAYSLPISDPVGQLTSIQTFDENGFYDFNERIGYDLNGRTIHREVDIVDRVDGSDSRTLGESYEYSLDGTERRTINPHGLEGIYTLGKDQYLRAVDIRLPNENHVESVIKNIAYNAKGKIEHIRYRQIDGDDPQAQIYAQTDLTYSPETLQITGIKSHYQARSQNIPLQDLQLKLNQNNSVNEIIDLLDPKDPQIDHGHISRNGTFAYNWKDELITENRYGKQYEYRYNGSGSFTHNGEQGGRTDRLNHGIYAETNLVPQGTENSPYSFDGFGQLATSPNILETQFNPLGKLNYVKTSDKHVYYGYNVSGDRVYKKVVDRSDAAQSERSLYPMQSIAFEPNSAQSYVFVADSRLVRLEHETHQWFYYLKDHLGSSDFIMSSSGLPVEQMLYHAYGSEEQPQAISTQWQDHVAGNQDALPKEKTHHRFTGKYLDDETGLYDFGARFYDPKLGRFISPDAIYLNDPNQCIQTVRECNLYIYSLNNPLKFVDDDGNSVWSKLAKVAVKVYKGGSAADAFADNVQDAMTLFDSNASMGDRLWAAASLASELLPVSVSDVKDVKRIVEKTSIGKPSEKIYSNAKDRSNKTDSTIPCCFVAGTQVLTDQGYRDIEDIKTGDKVWSKDTETGEQAFKPVTTLFVRDDREIYKVSVSTMSGEMVDIETTDDHPFYVVDAGWTRTLALNAGDRIETYGHGEVVVESIVDLNTVAPTYNFTIADFNTYYVTEQNVLVHNENCKGKVYRQLHAGDRARIDQGLGIQPKGNGGSIAGHVAGDDTGHISAALTEKATQRYASGNGLVEIDIKKAQEGGAKFIDHNNVLQATKRHGTKTDIKNAKLAQEVLFKGEIPANAIKLIKK